MSLDTNPFVQDYQPGAIHYGRGCVADLGTALAERDLTDALVVTGQNVGANRDVMGPIESGLGEHLADVFAETTAEKHVETAYDGVDRLRENDADAIVAVGGGSSLDTARFMQLLDAEYRPLAELRTEIEANGVPSVPTTGLRPTFVVPTTLAGADLSTAAAITYPTSDGGRAETIPVADALMPTGGFYDPALFETTPMDVLVGSAFNGFDKALECAYSAFATPITDATAVRALRYLRDSLPAMRDATDPAVMERVVAGIILAQYGVSRPDGYKLSVVHAFGHGLRNEFGLQQGIAHAVVVPHVLRLLFDQVDGRRDLLAEGLVTGMASESSADAVIEAVLDIRAGLGVPTRLRDLDGTTEDGLRAAARLTHEDPFMANAPSGFDPSVAELEAVLHEAW